MSRPPEESIALYGNLPPDEQAAVDAYVDAHPELRPLLEDARRLHVLAHYLPPPESLTDADVAEALLTEYLGPRSEAQRARVARVRATVEDDEALRATYDRLLQRLRALHEATTSPRSQFEALTGRRLPDPPPSARTPDSPRASDRPPVPAARPMRRVPLARWAAAAAVLLAAVAIGLIVSDPLLTPLHEQRADLAGLTEALPILRAPVRGVAPADSVAAAAAARATVRAAYADALAEVKAAYDPGVLGLFDGYDSDRLDAAAVRLRDVTARTDIAPDIALDATFTVGAIRLYQDQRPEACAAFERVVREEGPRSAEAQARLDEFCPGR